MAHEYCYPRARASLADYYEMTWRCAKCGYCRNVFPSDTEHERFGRQCPSGERFRFEAYYASGRNELARRTIEGTQPLSERMRHILYTCTTCGACEEWCEATQGLYPKKITMAVRNHFVDRGGGLLPAHNKLAQSVTTRHNRLGRNNRDRRRWLRDAPAPADRAEVAFFVGCRSSFNRSEIAAAAYGLLHGALDGKVTLLADERCCGRPLIDLGREADAVALMRHNAAQIEAAGASTVVCACAECFHSLRTLERFGVERRFEVVHLSELLSARDLGLRPTSRRIAFHDPCHLGRHQGVFEAPRRLLAALPGVEIVELPRNRKNAWCCGAGGGVQEAFTDFSQWTAAERLREVTHVGADTLVTACPGCKENLWASARAAGVEIMDLAELICAQVGG
jgi:Fe-S oxidoreductase